MALYEISGSSEGYATTTGFTYAQYQNGMQVLIDEGEEVLRNWPSYTHNGKLVRAIADAIGLELHRITVARDSVREQLFVSTATWGLKYWELYLGLPIRTDTDWADRRVAVMAVLSRRRFESETYFKWGLDLLTGSSSTITLGHPDTNPYEMDVEVGVQYYEDPPAAAPGLFQDYPAQVTFAGGVAHWRLGNLQSFENEAYYDYNVLSRADTVAFWKLNDAAGPTAVDSKTGAYALTYSGTPFQYNQTGPLLNAADGAVNFSSSGSTAVISRPFTAALQPTTGTFSAWVSHSNVASGSQTVIDTMGSTNYGLLVLMQATGNLVVQWGTGSGSGFIQSTASVPIVNGVWYHLAIVTTSTSVKVYINGILVGSNTSTTYAPATTGAFTLGRRQAGSSSHHGYLAKVSVHNAALTETEVRALALLGRRAACETSPLYDGFYRGYTTFVDGPIEGDSDLALDGTDTPQASVQVPYNSALNPAGAVAASALAYRVASNGATNVVIDSTATAANTGYQLYINSSNKLCCKIGNGTSYTTITGATTISDGAWHLLGFSVSGGTAKVFLDGVEDGSGAAAYTPNATNHLRIGAEATTVPLSQTSPFVGILDEAAVYSSAPSADEWAMLANLDGSLDPLPDPGSVPAGTYTYKVAFGYSSGLTTASSPSAAVELTSDGSVQLRNIPTGPAGTIGRLIYRKETAGTEYELVGIIQNNSDTIFVDGAAAPIGGPEADETTAITPMGRAINEYVARTKPAHMKVNLTASAFRASINAAGDPV